MQEKKRVSDVKLIAVDLDGTLLNQQRLVPPENKQALCEARRRGVCIVISTGSPYALIPFAQLTEIDVSYAITANGSAIYDYRTGECLYEECMDEELISRVVTFLDSLDVHFDMFIDGKGYSTLKGQRIIPQLDTTEQRKEYLRKNRICIAENPARYLLDNGLRVQKITVNFYPDEQGTLVAREQVKRFLLDTEAFELVSGGFGNLEITERGVEKGKTLGRLCDLTGIPITDTMAIGDSLNDLSIIRAAGIGVAMANGMEEVKRHADDITDSNDACGVAKAIWKYLGL